MPNGAVTILFDALLIPSITPCPVGTILGELDETSRHNLKAALDTDQRDLPSSEIARAIKAEAKRPIDPHTVSKHRRGECRCV